MLNTIFLCALATAAAGVAAIIVARVRVAKAKAVRGGW